MRGRITYNVNEADFELRLFGVMKGSIETSNIQTWFFKVVKLESAISSKLDVKKVE